MKTENKYLQVLGLVDKKILHQLLGETRYRKQNAQWFFVDYSPADYEMDTKFDIILEGEEKKIVPKIFNIKILDVIDQTGKHLAVIPLGWKTICRFEFKPHIPVIVQKLPILSRWEYNNTLKFARHADLVVDSNNFSKDVYTEVINDFISVSIHSQSINKKNKEAFLDTIAKVIHGDSQEMSNKISNPNLIEDVKRREFHIA